MYDFLLEFPFVIALTIAVMFAVLVFIRVKRARRPTWQRRHFPKVESRQLNQYPDAADQLRLVMNSKFSVQNVLNKGEVSLFWELDSLVNQINPKWKVMAQVSLGEILRCSDRNAFLCINAKRVDFLLMDGNCRPRYAIEYQGEGHYQGGAAARDAVKKEALRLAGIGYYEVVSGQTMPIDIKQLIERVVEKSDVVRSPSV